MQDQINQQILLDSLFICCSKLKRQGYNTYMQILLSMSIKVIQVGGGFRYWLTTLMQHCLRSQVLYVGTEKRHDIVKPSLAILSKLYSCNFKNFATWWIEIEFQAVEKRSKRQGIFWPPVIQSILGWCGNNYSFQSPVKHLRISTHFHTSPLSLQNGLRINNNNHHKNYYTIM